MVTLVQSVVGIGPIAAAAIMAEIGPDMSRFLSDKHLASWAGVSPDNKQSGGKRLNAATTSGNPYLRTMLGEISWAISHTKDNYLAAFYHCIARRRGKQKAIMALSHKVLVILYHILRDKKPYADLGADYFDKLDTARIRRHHIQRLEQLGFAHGLRNEIHICLKRLYRPIQRACPLLTRHQEYLCVMKAGEPRQMVSSPNY